MNVAQIDSSKQTPIIRDCQPTMSSREIAELTGKRHANVMRDIRNQEAAYCEVYGNQLKFELVKYADGKGEQRDEYRLNKSQALFVVSGYDSVRRAKVQKRMEDLEQQLSQGDPTKLSRIEILQIALESERNTLAYKAKIEADAPKVEFAEQVSVSQDAISVSEAAKIIGTGQKRLFAFLRHYRWVTRHNEPYQRMIDLGYMDVKVSKFTHPTQGLKSSVTALITGKGLLKLQQTYSGDSNVQSSDFH